jgi:hypothetical protein
LIDWEAVRKAVREHRGYPVAVLDRAGARGKHVVDETEEELKEAAAKDKTIDAKKKPEAKAKVEAVVKKPAPKKAEVVADVSHEVKKVTAQPSGSRHLNQ